MADKGVKNSTIPFGQESIILESGKLANRASGAVTVRHGETVILVAATVAAEERDTDFFPLTVDYEERMYAAGKISGSRFIKRENRPSEEAVLNGRLIDRSIRPLFPKTFRHEVQIIITTLAYDEQHDPSVLAVIGASAALLQTEAPFAGPIAAVRVGYIDNNFVLNPTESELEKSTLDLVVSGSAKKIIMIEAAANEVPEETIAKALQFAHDGIRQALEPQETFRSAKANIEHSEPASYGEIKKKYAAEFDTIVSETDYEARQAELKKLETTAIEAYSETNPNEIKAAIEAGFYKAIKKLVIEKKKRPDGRGMDEIRPLSAEVGILPRVHGSALFSRGDTQALTITTLAGPSEGQMIDTLEEFSTKRYMHHYNFPPYSTGEVRRMSTSRREIGHGALAEKALVPVIPAKEDFPYTIRLVSEIMSSNGSTSMAAVVGSTLSLMDAGVPIKKPVTGIAMGLVTGETDDEFQVLTDLQGLEDFAGEMDFKVAGTTDGITAIQLDVKNQGLTEKIIDDTLTKAKQARLQIMELVKKTLSEPRKELSKYAPRIIVTMIDPEKIGELIGPGGKTINKIIDDQGGREILNIDIDDDGTVMITSNDAAKAATVKAIVESIGKPIEVGQEFTGEVVQIVKDRNSGKEIGAIVQLTPNRDGMIHISSLGNGEFIERVSDVIKVGETTKVQVKAVDPEKGRISLVRIV